MKFSVAHPNPGKRSAENFTKISRQISRHLWQRKTEKIFTSALLQGSCSDEILFEVPFLTGQFKGKSITWIGKRGGVYEIPSWPLWNCQNPRVFVNKRKRKGRFQKGATSKKVLAWTYKSFAFFVLFPVQGKRTSKIPTVCLRKMPFSNTFPKFGAGPNFPDPFQQELRACCIEELPQDVPTDIHINFPWGKTLRRVPLIRREGIFSGDFLTSKGYSTFSCRKNLRFMQLVKQGQTGHLAGLHFLACSSPMKIAT